MSSSNVLLTQAQARYAMTTLTGVLTANVSISPDAGVVMQGFYMFENLTTGSFTVTLSNSSGSVVFPQSRRGIVWFDTSSTGPRIVSLVGSSTAETIPAGYSIPFYSASVPPGWTAVSLSPASRLINLVNNGSGGTGGGVIPFTTFAARTATDSHTLASAQMPSHTHSGTYSRQNIGSDGSGANVVISVESSGGTVAWNTNNTGSGDGHTHNIDCRVYYLNFVIGTRD